MIMLAFHSSFDYFLSYMLISSILLLSSLQITGVSSKMMAGGASDEKDATPEVQKIVDSVSSIIINYYYYY